MRLRLFVGLFFLFCFYSLPSIASDKSGIENQRNYFQQARKALREGNQKGFELLYKKLESYPLRPYLDIWQAQKALKKHADGKVLQTLQKYHDIPESVDLRVALIKNLAKRGQWPHVAKQLSLLEHSNKKLPDISLRSAWYNGEKKFVFQALSRQWRKGKNIQIYNIPFLFSSWHKAGFPALKDSQARIIYFAKRGKWKKAHVLRSYISKSDQQLLEHWRKLQKNPSIELQNIPKDMRQSHFIYPMIQDGLRRLSKLDSVASWKVLEGLKGYVTSKQLAYLQRNIALRVAKSHDIQSTEWLENLDRVVQNDETRAWHVRMLLLQKKWQESLSAIQRMPELQQSTSRWVYWKAYALQALNQDAAAKLLFEKLATDRGYYSFLSADQLQQPYRMNAAPIATQSIEKLENSPYMKRAYEWLQLHQTHKANREWYQALKGKDSQVWLQALQLAGSWGWYERAIQAAARAGVHDALSLRFPLAYWQDVQKQAKATGLQDSLIWSVMRQESAFQATAVSRSGARGLMQLMPKTARYVSKKHKLGHISSLGLFLPTNNIGLGTWYLSDLLKRFDKQLPLAIAAYNAGPTRVKRWVKHTPFELPALWIELIPFKETRNYVQQVTAFMAVYDWRKQQLLVQ